MTHFTHGAAVIVTTKRKDIRTKKRGMFVEVRETVKGSFYVVQIGGRIKKVRPVNVAAV